MRIMMAPNQKYALESKDAYEKLFKLWKSWNDPIYRVREDGVHSITEFMKAIENLFNADRQKFIFRGENQTYSTFLMPKIARNTENLVPYKNGTNLTQKEVDEIHNFQESKKGQLFGDDLSDNAVDWVPLAQHYSRYGRYSTRLLDVTRNALIALYFACEKDRHLDGWVYYFRENSFRPQTKPRSKVDKRDIEQGIPDTYLELFEPWERQPVYENIVHLFIPMKSAKLMIVHKRLHTQSSAFLWWHPISQPLAVEFARRNKPTQGIHYPILISNEAKEQIMQKLDKVFNINEETLFPPDED